MQLVNKSTSSNNVISNIVNAANSHKKKRTKTKKNLSLRYIDSEAFKLTMINYRVAVNKYNKFVREFNQEAREYNILVKAQLRAVEKANNGSINEQQLQQLVKFNQNNGGLKTTEYNSAVEEFNRTNGPTVIKKTLVEIKYQTELIFSVILGFYASQVQRRNELNIQVGQCVGGGLPDMRINSLSIASHKQEGVERLNVSQRTVQRHIKRLFEANILSDYHFQGTDKPIKGQISKEILVVKTIDSPLMSLAEKQGVTPDQTTTCRDSNEVTSTLKDNIKIKADVDNILKAEECSNLDTNLDTTKGSKPSLLLLSKILEPQLAARQLSQHMYDNHIPIPFEVLQREAIHGALSRADFKSLLIQEHLKYSAKLWKGKNVYVGSWRTVINMFEDYGFKSRNGRLYHKETMLNDLMKWRDMIDIAQRWFDRTKRNVLFPCMYFDYYRTDAKECGFWYVEKKWEYNQSKRKHKREIAKAKGEKRKKQIAYARRADNMVRKYFNKKISMVQLMDYFATLPGELKDSLSYLLEKESKKRNNNN